MVGRQVTRATRPPTTLAKLREQVEEAWDKVPQDIIRHLYDRLDERVSACIAARGGYTSY